MSLSRKLERSEVCHIELLLLALVICYGSFQNSICFMSSPETINFRITFMHLSLIDPAMRTRDVLLFDITFISPLSLSIPIV